MPRRRALTRNSRLTIGSIRGFDTRGRDLSLPQGSSDVAQFQFSYTQGMLSWGHSGCFSDTTSLITFPASRLERLSSWQSATFAGPTKGFGVASPENPPIPAAALQPAQQHSFQDARKEFENLLLSVDEPSGLPQRNKCDSWQRETCLRRT